MASLMDRRIEALATRLEKCVTKRALARMIATNAVVSGLACNEKPAAVEADLLALLKRYEELQVRQRIDEQRRAAS